MFTPTDIALIKQKGISMDDLDAQMKSFKEGFPFLDILGPATPPAHIHILAPQEQQDMVKRFESWNGPRAKFVPASGAASRMFKDLFAAKELLSTDPHAQLEGEAAFFFDHLHQFPFYPQLSQTQGFDEKDRAGVLECLLGEKGLRYGFLPKALLAFHAYEGISRTALEEHMVEGALYGADGRGKVHLHFTVSKEHLPDFVRLCETVQPVYEQRFGVQYQIDFSMQKPSTDTLAVDADNHPFRNTDGTLLFRPAGHGALLENLNEMKEDIVFVKNIDNVVSEPYLDQVVLWKKVLAGKLLEYRQKTMDYISRMHQTSDPLLLKEVASFLHQAFGVALAPMPEQEYRSALFAKLNRPIRVCGMVIQSGEPGGGPFCVRDADGATSHQILEGPQLPQKYASATHFNPVDMVCSFKDYEGNPFKLKLFRDDNTGFISLKSKEGRALKALELPGLWNGAMSSWNTSFIEVPLEIFNPVKIVNDLLRKRHFL